MDTSFLADPGVDERLLKKNNALKDAAHLRRLELRRFERGLQEKRRKQARRATHGAGVSHRPRAERFAKQRQESWEEFPVPSTLDFFADPTTACQFFADVNELVRHRHRICLDFKATEHISSECLIYLLGQIQKLQLEYGKDRLTGSYPKSRRIERLLSESGFLHLLRVKRRPIPGRKPDSTRFLRYKSGTTLQAEAIPQIREELLGDDMQMPMLLGKKVFRALSEAMANSGEHAYISKSLKSHDVHGRWWMGAQLSLKKNLFSLTFYDAGVGIPKTLPRRYGVETIRKALSLVPGMTPDDGEMIKAAVELGRTRTGKDERGRGLLDLHKLIDAVGAGSLAIFSRNGRYVYTNSGETSSNDTNFVEGTLIRWELPLDRAGIGLQGALAQEYEQGRDDDFDSK